jgi:hypothetical protein
MCGVYTQLPTACMCVEAKYNAYICYSYEYICTYLRHLVVRVTGGGEVFREFFNKNRFGLGPLHYISSRSDFNFEFAEIFVIEKRLPDSPSRGVDKIACRYNCFRVRFFI